ncbi:Wadjet anti-phage system protein JetA family protein [Glaciimonas sp. PCH181]|uniref:Wadjet anti-phage system protein JetA family protein n=1 Tax=Glaciimonas sp. PCH181 TaxID=2133943 RepID=UPI000D3C6BF2|nr:Wadjet anti-phage system protein JetA family protein [Glaciimonas sp. PCH181]PUA17022.1 ferrochelatase [Glaciimonas sp. PCH181]
MFFESDRLNFFRPIAGKHRTVVVACLRTLYERLHGPSADYGQNLTRDSLRDLLLPVVQDARHLLAQARQDEADSEDESTLPSLIPDNADDQQSTSAVVRALHSDGWLETFGDRAGLVTAYRFSRAGKLFAEAFWALDRRSARTRQRNVRSCRNALNAALRNIDAYDLVDAYEYAEKIISDISEGVDYFQELVRRLMLEASQTPWDNFMEFLDRFEKEFKKQLTADSIERHRQAIRDVIAQLHSLDDAKSRALEAQLNDIARWAMQERVGASTVDWMLERIEEMVEAACTTKHPELIKAMSVYMQRAASIVQQALMLRGGQTRQAYTAAIAKTASLSGDAQNALLARIGQTLAPAEIRLLDPATFKLRTISQRRKALTVTAQPKVSRDARLAAALYRAEADAFALSNDDVVQRIRAELRLRDRPIRLSSLPTATTTDVLNNMQMVEAIRGARDPSLKITKLPNKLWNDFYAGDDYQIEMKK